MNFSTKTRSSPKEDLASDRARREALRDLLAGLRDPHAFAPAAGGSLDHHRIADLVGDLSRPLRRFDRAEIAGDGRDLGRVGEFLRFDLVAHRLDGFGVRTDKDDLRFREGMREGRALREKAVARMDGLGAGLAGTRRRSCRSRDRTAPRRRAYRDGLSAISTCSASLSASE